MYTLLGSVV